ncbi:hypothetical protein [Pseudomonas sp. CGJS7]|uniref:hypothetical protein n=1 Tax=Pseudomonas sp. CGJS7 TaxID=3109348 RepID=UPI00300B5070
MIPFKLNELTSAPVAKLKAGEFFYFGGSHGPWDIGVVLKPLNDRPRIMSLTGEDSFRIKVSEFRSAGLGVVLPLKLDQTRIRLRIDPNGSAEVVQSDELKLGCVSISHDGPAGIRCAYIDMPVERYRTVALLSDWEVEPCEGRFFAAEKWAFTYLDDSNSWVDFFSNG